MSSHEHCHNHQHNQNEKVVLTGFLLTFSFMIVEIIGGILSNSLALIADAGHMLIDSTALILAWAGFYFGNKKASNDKSFGYFRLEVLAAFFNALTLFLLTIWIAYEAYQRLKAPAIILSGPMLVVAVAGLLVNCLVFYILNKGDKEHLNIKGAMLHVLGDLLGSVGAIAAALIIKFTGWMPIDSIFSILFCLIIFNSTWRLLRNSLNILMEGAPSHIDVKEIEKKLSKLKNVESVSHIHVWSISSGKVMITLNILVCDDKEAIKTIENVKKELKDKFDIDHSTVEVGLGHCSLKR